MKINWFGNLYYGDSLQYKRTIWIAFKCFVEWDIWDKFISGKYYIPDKKGGWITCYRIFRLIKFKKKVK